DGTQCEDCPAGTAKVPAGANVVDAECVAYGEPDYPCGSAQIAADGVCKSCGYGRVAISGSECDYCPDGSVKQPAGNNQVNAQCVPYGSPDYSCGTSQVALEGVCKPCGYGRVAI